MKLHRPLPSVAAALFAAAFSFAAEAPAPAEALLKGLKARSIGPAIMGGRVSAIEIDPRNPLTFYVAFATSGVWKTTNNGVSFSPVFDDQPVQSTGAIALAPSNPDIVWVGTGEANDRNSSGWGNGVYKSTDGGAKWQHMGLKDSRAIADIVVHPTNPDIVYVGVAGHLWANGGERGVYKTTDGGKTWKQILSAPKPHDAITGTSDLKMDPHNPEVLYATLYARQRKPWAFLYGVSATGGADVGGIFKTTDGGATWTKLTNGLPALTGNIGLALSRSKPGVVMAVVQSDEGGTSDIDENHSRKGGTFRSEDGGATWTRVNSLCPRPFYFGRLNIDPVNDQRVYVQGWIVYVSDDGGKNFREDFYQKVHVDVHAFAIQPGSHLPPKPADPAAKDAKPAPPVSQRLIVGNDGGIYQSFDAGATWDFLNKIPAGQFYRIAADLSTPYRVAGGLQDNTNWVGPSQTFHKEGIRNHDWTQIGGGDGFSIVFDPDDRDVIYAESQDGYLHRFNGRTGEIKSLRPNPSEGQARFRFHWNSPLFASKHTKGVMYLGGNRVAKLTNQAEHFELISPDLSHNAVDKVQTVGSSAENYAVVYALDESPLKAGLLLAGTDDGRLWYTEDEGGKWNEITDTIPAEVRGKWIARIEPSHFDATAAHVVFTDYRFGNDTPYIYKFTGFGKTWTRVNGDLPAHTPVAVVREDPVNPNLLYAGTEFSLYTSLNAGKNWVKLGDIPNVRVDDLLIHPREHDLVVGTHGRSLYILDDTQPLREFTAEVAAKDAHLFSIRPAYGRYHLPGWDNESGKGWFKGANPAEGALLTVWIREFTGEKFTVTIKNSHGHTMAKFEQVAAPGFNRFNWDLKLGKDYKVQYGGDDGDRFCASGEYTAELSYKDVKAKQTFKVTIEPGIRTHGTFAQ